MAYVTVAEFRTEYKDMLNPGDDAFVERALNAAEAALDAFLDRNVYASADTTEYFDYGGREFDGRRLYLSDRGDICAITTVTNGDTTTISSANYALYPATLSNRRPVYQQLTIQHSAGVSWTSAANGDADNVISVEGRWSMYSTTAAIPDDFKLSVMELAAFAMESRKSQVFDTTAIPDAGVITIPAGWPVTVRVRMAPYRRQAVAA